MPYTKGHTIQHHDFSGLGACACCGQEVTHASIIRSVAEETGLSGDMVRSVAKGRRAGSAATHKAIDKAIRKHVPRK